MSSAMAGAQIGSSLIGGAISAWGQHQANKSNLAIAREQMAFQERMRDTAYQAAVKDMQAAGLNPALAYQQGGAQAMPGAGAHMENVGKAGVEGAFSAAQLRNLSAQNEVLESQADNIRSETELNRNERSHVYVSQKFLNDAQAHLSLRQQTLVNKQVEQIAANTRLSEQELKLLLNQVENIPLTNDKLWSMVRQMRAGATYEELSAEFKEMERSKHSAWERFYNTAGQGAPMTQAAATLAVILATLAGLRGVRRPPVRTGQTPPASNFRREPRIRP